MVSESGEKWNYSAGNTQLLAAIIRKVSGVEIDEFARENLFDPVGIRDVEWTKLTLKNVPAAASGLRLRSGDLLKLGVVYLNNGKFNDRRIVDSAWIESSLSPQVQRPDLTYLNLENGGYGYQFWTYNFNWSNRKIAVAEAKGNGGQSLFICRQLNLVVVITAGNYGQVAQNGLPYKVLKDYILPSIK